ncbi:MAG: hypothetical protein GC160_23365 [Acidobacteria bacterium]|nr:hypothetical protein [Acidobacteriota bacterium]
MRLLLALAFCVSAATAQEPPAEKGSKVSGRVLDARTGRPLPGATVLVSVQPPSTPGAGNAPTAVTAFDGRFVLQGVPAGEVALSVAKNGYDRTRRSLRTSQGTDLAGVDLHLNRFAVITGRTLDHEGRPLPGASVRLQRRTMGPALDGRAAGAGMRRSDDRGVFRIWYLRPGDYLVCGLAAANLREQVTLRSGGACYPETSAIGEATPVRLGWGDIREEIDLRLPPPAPTRLDIRVVLEDGSPADRTELQFFERTPAGEHAFTEVGAPNGQFSLLGAAPGEYRILASRPGQQRSELAVGQAEVSIPRGQPTGLMIQVHTARTRAGRLLLVDPPDDLLQQSEPAQLTLNLDTAEPSGMGFRPNARAMIPLTSADVGFEIDVAPGRYRASVRGVPTGGYLAETRFDGQPNQDGRLVIPVGGLQTDLAVTVRFDGGAIEAHVDIPEAWREAASAATGLLPEGGVLEVRNARNELVGLPPLDLATGQAKAHGLQPGRYRLVARPANAPWTLTDPVALTEWASSIKEVDVRAGQATRIELELAPER